MTAAVAEVAGCWRNDGFVKPAPALRCIAAADCMIGRGMRLLLCTFRGIGATCLFLIRV